MQSPRQILTVTAVHHVSSGNITAFFNELPGLLVQGNSDDDVKQKLRSLLNSFKKRLDAVNDFDIKTQIL